MVADIDRASNEIGAAADVFPLHLALTGRRVVVVGGGPVAARKVSACLDARAEVVVVAPYACEPIVDGAAQGLLTWHRRDYADGDLDDAWLVFAATGDRLTDQAVEEQATRQRVFCVRADDAAVGTARSPAVLRRDGLVISVGTAAMPDFGRTADPRRVVAVRNAIAQALDSGSLPLRRHRPGPGRVVLVGGGPGDPDLLTLRGRRELAAADVVVIDRLAPRDILDELAPGVLILDVGKAAGRHPVPQEEINRLLVEHALAGRHVVRLKGGDSYVFGRGGEEVAACRQAGVSVEVVPGVTSAFSVPAAAGIPVTHRGVSRRVTVMSGHDAADDPDDPVDWHSLAVGGGTLVVLMGVAALPAITAGLLAGGMDPRTPAAVIEEGWTVDERTTIGTVTDIARRAEEVGASAPAVIVIGAVVELSPLGMGQLDSIPR